MSRRIPAFEGHIVHGTAVKMSGAIPMDNLDDVIIGQDDVVQVIAQFKCVGVNHHANGKGELIRIQTLRPVGMALEPFEVGRDDGVLRALPRIVPGEIEASAPVCTCGTEDDGHGGKCALIMALGMGSSLQDGEKIYLTFGQNGVSGE